MTISFEATAINITPESDARLVLRDGVLIAIMVRLSGEYETPDVAGWYVEIGFGGAEDATGRIFPDLEQARDWFEGRTGLQTSGLQNQDNARLRSSSAAS